MGKRNIIGITLALSASQTFASPKMTAQRTIEVQGHRGARAVRPENTLPAFQYALEVGVDVLEFDLAVTKDKVLVISHDPHLSPVLCQKKDGTPAKELAIYSLSLKDIKTYECGARRNPKFPAQVTVPGTEIPTLDEVLTFVKTSQLPTAKRVQFNIETKSFPKEPTLTPPPAEFAALLLTALKQHGVLARTVIQSFDHRTLVEARRLEPKARLSVLTASDETRTDYIQLMEELRPEVLSPNWEEISVGEVKAVQALGIRVVPWTANTAASWDKLIKMGVDGIISDDPLALINYLKEKKIKVLNATL